MGCLKLEGKRNQESIEQLSELNFILLSYPLKCSIINFAISMSKQHSEFAIFCCCCFCQFPYLSFFTVFGYCCIYSLVLFAFIVDFLSTCTAFLFTFGFITIVYINLSCFSIKLHVFTLDFLYTTHN